MADRDAILDQLDSAHAELMYPDLGHGYYYAIDSRLDTHTGPMNADTRGHLGPMNADMWGHLGPMNANMWGYLGPMKADMWGPLGTDDGRHADTPMRRRAGGVVRQVTYGVGNHSSEVGS